MNGNIGSIINNDFKNNVTTKEKILDVAIDLFSSKGYNDVSVREIAKEVGIKNSSIYYHYSKKEDILDSIFEYFIKEMNDEEIVEENMEELINQSPMNLYHFGSELVKEHYSSTKMKKILRLIFIELYHNEKIRDFFKKEIIDRPLKFWIFLFQQFMDKKIIKVGDPKQLAESYYNYGIFKMFESIVLNYPEDPNEIDLDPIFDNIEDHFYFILNSSRLEKDDELINKPRNKHSMKNIIEFNFDKSH